MANVIIAIILGIISAGSFFLGYRHLNEKGALLNNAYLYESKDGRLKMNKKPYYRQSGIVFILIGIVFATNAIEVILTTDWLFYLSVIVIVITFIYAIISSVLIKQKH